MMKLSQEKTISELLVNSYRPTVFNIFKPVGKTSYDVVRSLKKSLPKDYGKIGHFGTLDPFACGVLLVGIAGAARLNEYIHSELPKTYLAIGKLGIQTDSGDPTSPIINQDDSDYINKTIAKFDKVFIENFLRQKFIGNYLQSPPKHSATKFQGRPLHEWARNGVEIKKEKVQRTIYKLEVVKYVFPYLSIRFEVSSGTYIRTLFEDCANELGTIGSLVALVRESIGSMHIKDSLNLLDGMNNIESKSIEDVMKIGLPIEKVLPWDSIFLDDALSFKFNNGVSLNTKMIKKVKRTSVNNSSHLNQQSKNRWVFSNNSERLLGFAQESDDAILTPIAIFR